MQLGTWNLPLQKNKVIRGTRTDGIITQLEVPCCQDGIKTRKKFQITKKIANSESTVLKQSRFNGIYTYNQVLSPQKTQSADKRSQQSLNFALVQRFSSLCFHRD